jgi:bifunctional UDP-N-acetylglucosamine pyrophosphorylase/glucosamine-1-phosphate N-acetyltransferase
MAFFKDLSVAILAAGKGERMKSDIPKVLHKISGKPMLYYALSLAVRLKPKNIFVVVGHKGKLVSDYIKSNFPKVKIILQEDQLGTAHAVSMLKKQKENLGKNILIIPGDCPLIKTNTLKKLVEGKIASGSPAYIITSLVPDPEGYGRVIKDKRGNIIRIVEEADASPEEKKINEINSSIYCFDCRVLFENLGKIKRQNVQGEYYLTDIIEVLIKNGKNISCMEVGDYREVLGINDRIQLNKVEDIMQKNRDKDLLKNEAVG